jgi:flavin reductase (DIM6/NTAB) family NADH-FMN oxidoreductase RutF
MSSSPAVVFGAGVGSGIIALLALQFLRRYGSKSIAEEVKKRNWQIGDKQKVPYSDKIHCLDPVKIGEIPGALYGLMISSVVPRPIALVSSQDASGVLNCSPYSYFNMMCHDPPIICIGCCVGRGKKKDTLNNIQETGQFVVNIMSDWYVESANHCCGNFPPEVNEIDISGLTTAASTVVKAPRIQEAAISLECEVLELKPAYNAANEHAVTVVMAKIVKFHIQDHVLVPGSLENQKPLVDARKLAPICRLGGNTYGTVGEMFDLPRPSNENLYRKVP